MKSVSGHLNDMMLVKCSFFTAEQEGRSAVPHVECYSVTRRLVAKRRLSWRRLYASVHVVDGHSR